MFAQLIDHPAAAPLAGISLALFALGAIALPFVITRLPADYFVRPPQVASGSHAVWRTALYAIKNIVGALLLAAGVLMLVLPGQGLLAILFGLSLLDFPGKRRLQRRMLRLPGVLQVTTALRRRAGRAPFELGPERDSAVDDLG